MLLDQQTPVGEAIAHRLQELYQYAKSLDAAERRGEPSPGVLDQVLDEIDWLNVVATAADDTMRRDAATAIEAWQTYAEALEADRRPATAP